MCKDKKQVLILVRGLPGSGKSTFAKKLGYKHFEADMYHIVDGQYFFVPERVKDAHEWCFNSTEKVLRSGYSVVVSNTFTQMWEMKKYLDLAVELNITVQVVECKGSFGSVHNVPDDVIAKMRDRWEEYNGA